MTSPAFQVFADATGNLYVQDGMVAQLKTGVRIPVGAGGNFSPPPIWGNLPFLPAAEALGATFVGGSGRNLALAGLPVPLSGVMPPVGLFSPTRPDTFVRGIFTLAVTGSSAATIHDGTDAVATLSAGGTAPVGNYVATTYGEDTYNGGTAFTIAAALEIAGGGAIPDAGVLVSAGTAQGGTYTATNSVLYVSATDSHWTIVIATDGSAELRIDSNAIATRAAGACAWLPDGFYQATAAGMAAYNLTDAEPDNGEAFNVFISSAARMPRAGFVYLTITEAGGVLSAVDGPFFATSLPADSSTVFHVPLAQCDGAAIEQFHTGLMIWPEPDASRSNYVTIENVSGFKIAPNTASKNGFVRSGLACYVSGAANSGTTVAVFFLTAEDFPDVNGVAAVLRVKGEVHCNDVQPHASMTFVFGLYPVTRPATSGGTATVIQTLGTVVSGSECTINAPEADSSTSVIGSTFALPADGWYALGVVTDQTFATSSFVTIRAELQRRN